jgi:hypothetical protein
VLQTPSKAWVPPVFLASFGFSPANLRLHTHHEPYLNTGLINIQLGQSGDSCMSTADECCRDVSPSLWYISISVGKFLE